MNLQIGDWKFGFVTIFVGLIFLSEITRLSYFSNNPETQANARTENLLLLAIAVSAAIAVVVLGKMFESRKSATDALLEKEERIQNFARLSPVGQFLTDAAGLDIFVNDRWSEFTGLKGQSALGEGWESALHPDDREHTISTWREAVENHTNFHAEYRYVRPDGKVTWIQCQAIANTAGEGRFLGYVGTVTDVTARKRAEVLFRALLEAAPDAMIVIDGSGSITLVNAQAQSLFGYSRQELLTKKIEELIPARFRPNHQSHRNAYALDPRVRPMGGDLELYGLRKDGHEFPVEVSLGPIETDEGSLISAAIRDVTARKKSEQALRKLQGELSRASRSSAVGQLASTLAHELNQPMTAVMNYVRASQRTLEASGVALPSGALDLMNKAADQMRRASEIVQNLRRFIGQDDVEREIVDLNSVVEEVSMSSYSGAARNDVAFRVIRDSSLPPVLINRIQVQQVVANLVRNALDAMKDTETRRLTVETSLADENFVKVAVADTGTGLPPDVIPRIFEPFVTTKADGMGIGLSICFSNVEAHGGTLWATPNPDGGTVFRFTVPIAPVENGDDAK